MGRNRYEAHLPALQARSQTPPRLSRAHGHAGRPGRSAPPPQQGPQEAVRLTAACLTTSAATPDGEETPGAAPLSPELPPELSLERLTRRADFVALRRGRRASAAAFTLQVSPTPRESPNVGPRGGEGDGSALRVGFTVTKKVGNAVERNRIKRRFRAAVRLWAAGAAPALQRAARGRDMVLVARREALAQPFEALVADLDRTVRRVLLESPRSKRHSGTRGKRPRGDAADRR